MPTQQRCALEKRSPNYLSTHTHLPFHIKLAFNSIELTVRVFISFLKMARKIPFVGKLASCIKCKEPPIRHKIRDPSLSTLGHQPYQHTWLWLTSPLRFLCLLVPRMLCPERLHPPLRLNNLQLPSSSSSAGNVYTYGDACPGMSELITAGPQNRRLL